MLGGQQVTFCGYNLTAHFATLRTQNVKQAFLGAAYRTPRMNLSLRRLSMVKMGKIDRITV